MHIHIHSHIVIPSSTPIIDIIITTPRINRSTATTSKKVRRKSSINLSLSPKDALSSLLTDTANEKTMPQLDPTINAATTTSSLSKAFNEKLSLTTTTNTTDISTPSTSSLSLPLDLLNTSSVVFMKPTTTTTATDGNESTTASKLVLLKTVSDEDMIHATKLRIFSLGMFAHCFQYPDEAFPPSASNKQQGSNETSSSSTDIASSSAKQNHRRMSVRAEDRTIPQPPPLPKCWPPDFVYDDQSGNDDGIGISNPNVTTAGSSTTVTKPPSGPKMKQVYWDQITDDSTLQKSLWHKDIPTLPSTEALFEDIVEMFGAKVNTKLAVGGADKDSGRGKGSNTKQPKKIKMFLDPQRGQAIGIMLAKFGKRSADDIAQAIKSLNTQAMGLSQVSSILNLLPLPEEIDSLTQHIASGEEVNIHIYVY